MRFLRLVAWLALLAVLAAAPLASAVAAAPNAEPPFIGSRNCRIEKPAPWGEGGRYAWLGACRGGFAHGDGALRNTLPDGSIDLWLGTVEHGRLRWGALRTSGGYVVGQWQNGAVVAIEDDIDLRNATVKAFRTAERAARKLSARMIAKGNAASGRFYRGVADELAKQTD